MLLYLGRFSETIRRIATAFPVNVYQRSQYLEEHILSPKIVNYVVCSECHALYEYQDCLERVGTDNIIKYCMKCLPAKQIHLLKKIVTVSGSTKYYPHLTHPRVSLISQIRMLVKRPEFLESCERWKQSFTLTPSILSDLYDGSIWRDLVTSDNVAFFSLEHSLGLMINIDWFQPFKHTNYSVGVIYLTIVNLPRSIRFKRENVLVVGMIPGPSEPSLTVNSYLQPLVLDLLSLWKGVHFTDSTSKRRLIRCALICIACDLPAARKVSGFLSYTANRGCSRCECNFGTGHFGHQNYGGFDRNSWVPRTNKKHREQVKEIGECATKTERLKKESKYGCRYSCLLELPYFDAVNMLSIDPMQICIWEQLHICTMMFGYA